MVEVGPRLEDLGRMCEAELGSMLGQNSGAGMDREGYVCVMETTAEEFKAHLGFKIYKLQE